MPHLSWSSIKKSLRPIKLKAKYQSCIKERYYYDYELDHFDIKYITQKENQLPNLLEKKENNFYAKFIKELTIPLIQDPKNHANQ